ncbi:MAG: RidA family protein [Rhodobacteraceae bacterium]|nr:RidA family protein [Paracoccaceae bacterium]MCY4250190.1 RidA family protein [Paracoccaceae bacterium]MCY4308058.1 RidA family protein [Paracoccaceae bacterium]
MNISNNSYEVDHQNIDEFLPNLPPEPIGCFRNVILHGGLAWVSGQGPIHPDGCLERGKVGVNITAEAARKHARLVGLNIVSALRLVIGDLGQIDRVVKLQGLVNSSPDFERHSFVIDGASELMKEVFGERGIHARTSFGVSSLPNNITVEIDGVFALRQEQ